MKVLICDDEPLAVERLSRLVSKMGHEVVSTAHHGQGGLGTGTASSTGCNLT